MSFSSPAKKAQLSLVFRVFDPVIHKIGYAATEPSSRLKISDLTTILEALVSLFGSTADLYLFFLLRYAHSKAGTCIHRQIDAKYRFSW